MYVSIQLQTQAQCLMHPTLTPNLNASLVPSSLILSHPPQFPIPSTLPLSTAHSSQPPRRPPMIRIPGPSRLAALGALGRGRRLGEDGAGGRGTGDPERLLGLLLVAADDGCCDGGVPWVGVEGERRLCCLCGCDGHFDGCGGGGCWWLVVVWWSSVCTH
ncbi:uncharacterized protein K452DRAFT_167721 [Aplosporella prunicola CBS 121167]|uniref:Uncharacterized protein n=1 Tax=Aplosporella prunicola CBS 121167 TaxID=1176127 RepID=A0A6A6BK63_9PEZI|nr:uncharacterized protein K452DRAFT_167721 [Aplosporella prunicola CBS 121167]KAF2143227.1 hypothetical protein K452DRAFT_167721 [Aplosporella prunicola CBS 121167]